MTKSLYKLILSIFLVFAAVPVLAGTLWGKTKTGMSPEEVMNVTKNAHKVENGDTIGSRTQELLRIDNYEVVYESFRVSFYFANRKLEQVTLMLNDRKPFSSLLPIFRQLANILQSKYGKEFSTKEHPNAPIAKSALRTWMNDHTDITLFAIGIADQPADLFLMYKTNLAQRK